MDIGKKNIFWIAGESSGDLHSSMVIKKLKQRGKVYNHMGIGGYNMQKEGFKPFFPFKKFSQMGFLEVLSKLPFFLKVESEIKKLFEKSRPDLVILVDFPGFNLRIAKIAYEMDIPVIFFICPQFWAWKHKRVSRLRTDTTVVACILPFEKQLLNIHRVNSVYVGHPIAEEIEFSVDKETFANTFGLNPERKWISFMPGSRNNEIVKILPAFIDAIKLFKSDEYEFLISKSHSVKNELFWHYIPRSVRSFVTVIDGYIYEMMKYSHFVTATSGTATLEIAYIGTPLAIVYKTSWVSYEIGKALIKIKRIGLPNIILDRDVVPELIQSQVTGKNIQKTITSYLEDENKYLEMKKELQSIRALLQEKTASEEMADLVERYISR